MPKTCSYCGHALPENSFVCKDCGGDNRANVPPVSFNMVPGEDSFTGYPGMVKGSGVVMGSLGEDVAEIERRRAGESKPFEEHGYWWNTVEPETVFKELLLLRGDVEYLDSFINDCRIVSMDDLREKFDQLKGLIISLALVVLVVLATDTFMLYEIFKAVTSGK
jgi:hypothetical protein